MAVRMVNDIEVDYVAGFTMFLYTFSTSVSEGLHPSCGVHKISALSSPQESMLPLSGDTLNAPRHIHVNEAVALPSFVKVSGYWSVFSRLSGGN